MAIRVGVDIGGTFTDFALAEDGAAHTVSHKTLTSADDPSRAVVQGLAELLQVSGHSFSDIEVLAHGTTLVTNAVIERKGALTGMVVTEGFANIVDIARENRYELFDLRIDYAEPIVPRAWRVEVPERIARDGAVTRPLDERTLIAGVEALIKEQGITSLAICFINSYRNPVHEMTASEIIRKAFPNLYLSISSQVANTIKEYERWTTTLINSYTQPLIDRYLHRLETELSRRGFRGTLRIMTSSGGAFDAALSRAFPVRLIESGPAAGILISSRLAEAEKLSEILAFDIGGTTAKGAFVQNARPIKKYEMEVGRARHFRPGSGLPVRVPVIDMIEIGSGGGSIARVDSRGLIAVGPTSASSIPGPACYDLGGAFATLTDANLVLGFLDKDFFLGGRMRLKPDLARAVIDKVRAQIGSSSIETAAEGIREIAAEDVAAAFRTHAAELGLDVRRSTLIAFGGSGPVMATLVARKLHIRSVLFPAGSGVFSAIGLLASPASFEVTRTFRTRLELLGDDEIGKLFAELSEEAARALIGMKVRPEDIILEQVLDLRYVGQGHQVRIALPECPGAGGWNNSILRRFKDEYARTFSINVPESEVEVTDWRVVATENQTHAPATAVVPSISNGVRVETIGSYWNASNWLECRKISRYGLKPTDMIHGPALIQEVESTCVLLPGDVGTVLPSGHIQVEIPDRALKR